MKALFLAFQHILPCDGISKKIISENNALKHKDLDIKLTSFDTDDRGNLIYKVGEQTIETYGKGLSAKVRKRFQFGKLTRYIIDNDIRFLYIRYIHFANPFFVLMFRKLHRHGIVMFLEIPSFPYDCEYKTTLRTILPIYTERLCRKSLARYVDRIVTFSGHDRIWNRPTIRISNGIDLDKIPVKHADTKNPSALNLIGVAGLMFWHGFDRVIEGLHEYYKIPRSVEVRFNIVGGKSDSEILKELKNKTSEYGLDEYVVFHGEKSGEALDKLFDQNDVAIGSLGCHRIHNVNVRPLKNREYAARGIPFVYAVNDGDFTDKHYVLRISADESPVRIQDIIDFYFSDSFDPADIRRSIEDTLSWHTQMQTVKDELTLLIQ